jgi:error-prone DNA polymerase
MGFYAPAQIVRCAREHGVGVHPVDANASDWDHDVMATDLQLGLRQIDGFRALWAQTMMQARPFASIEDLTRRAALPPRALRLLADADALRSLGFDRREGAWEARRMPADELPLFAAARARELAEEAPVNLPAMGLGEHVVADYQTVRLSLKAHPLAILRDRFAAQGIASCAQIAAAKNGQRIRGAGLVLVRQRPGNGKAIFITLEDESGVTNIVLWSRQFERYRRAVMASRLMLVEGEVQRSPEGVVHLMAHRVIDRTADLLSLAETCQSDSSGPHNPRQGHPRAVRSFPKSRDFH